MRPHKSTILIALVALLLTALVAVMAQTPAQDSVKRGDQKKATESCCAMDSCCCNNGSCPMMKEGTANPDGTAANADARHDCCGDSCGMKKEGADGTTASADAKHDCCGDSCDMANHAKHDKHDKKTHMGDGSCCKAKSKDAKQKDAKTN